MKNLDKRFTIMTEANLASVNGGKNGYGGSGNRWVHCGAGIVGGALIGAIGGPWSAVAGGISGGFTSCR